MLHSIADSGSFTVVLRVASLYGSVIPRGVHCCVQDISGTDMQSTAAKSRNTREPRITGSDISFWEDPSSYP